MTAATANGWQWINDDFPGLAPDIAFDELLEGVRARGATLRGADRPSDVSDRAASIPFLNSSGHFTGLAAGMAGSVAAAPASSRSAAAYLHSTGNSREGPLERHRRKLRRQRRDDRINIREGTRRNGDGAAKL